MCSDGATAAALLLYRIELRGKLRLRDGRRCRFGGFSTAIAFRRHLRRGDGGGGGGEGGGADEIRLVVGGGCRTDGTTRPAAHDQEQQQDEWPRGRSARVTHGAVPTLPVHRGCVDGTAPALASITGGWQNGAKVEAGVRRG